MFVYYEVFLFWQVETQMILRSALHVSQATFVPLLSGVSPSSGDAFVHICGSVAEDLTCIPLLRDEAFLLWSSLLSDNLPHKLKPCRLTQIPISVSSTDNYCLAFPNLCNGFQRVSWGLICFLYVRDPSTLLPVVVLENYCFMFCLVS